MISADIGLQFQVNEASMDTRLGGTTGKVSTLYVQNAFPWQSYSSSGFGRRLQQSLAQGQGYSAEVADMGRYVSVRASYNNTGTGKSVSKTFVIVFDNPKKGDGTVWIQANKWRTISSVEQASTYIKQIISSYSV